MRKLTKKFRKSFDLVLAIAVLLSSLSACGKDEGWRAKETRVIDDNYRTWYEIFVYSFCDSDGDQVGDLQGVISKLDYIEDLSFNGIWLMPVMPSPSYHKYDVTDGGGSERTHERQRLCVLRRGDRYDRQRRAG